MCNCISEVRTFGALWNDEAKNTVHLDPSREREPLRCAPSFGANGAGAKRVMFCANEAAPRRVIRRCVVSRMQCGAVVPHYRAETVARPAFAMIPHLPHR
ncbi:MAG: hypothetical protein NTAFB05_21050 [Nitrobacter sp.]